jgi:FkbM family methyltransferase
MRQVEILEQFSGYTVNGLTAENDGDIAIYYVCKELLPKAEGVCMDVGADKGAWTEMCLSLDPNRVCHVFEPNPSSFLDLVVRFEMEEGVRLNPYAISDTEGKVHMDLNGPQSRIGEGSELVDTAPLHTFLEEDETIALLKIDTEGHDARILASLHPILPRIHAIVSEWTPYWYGANIVEQITTSKKVLEDLARSFSYIYALSRRGAPFCVSLQPDDYDDFLEEHIAGKIQTDLLFTRHPIQTIPVVPYQVNMWFA